MKYQNHVAGLLIKRLNKLSHETAALLVTAVCLGHSFQEEQLSQLHPRYQPAAPAG